MKEDKKMMRSSQAIDLAKRLQKLQEEFALASSRTDTSHLAEGDPEFLKGLWLNLYQERVKKLIVSSPNKNLRA
jgi:hypothetical protein